jgi:hypothetical protein
VPSIRHLFTSSKADQVDASEVRASDWNADHVVYDPLGLGYSANGETGSFTAASVWGTANAACYQKLVSAGYAMSSIRIRVNVQSGNICAGVYSNNGSTGTAARPGSRTATTGAIACPASGTADLSLGGSVTPAPGDWFGFSCDNTTASFVRRGTAISQGGDTMWDGRVQRQLTAHPLPNPAVPASGYEVGPLMIGV